MLLLGNVYTLTPLGCSFEIILDVYELLCDAVCQEDLICKPWIATSDSMIL